jgi:two-component system sensor histidine kinase PilS (NtrC family)
VTGERLQRRESDLAALATLHGTVVQSMTAGLVTLDAARRVTFLNAAGEQLIGTTSEEARGRPSEEVLPTFDLEGGSRGELDHARAGKPPVRLGYTAFPLVAPDGRTSGTAVIFQDLTRFREMEEAVQRSARLADLGRVAAGLAHELRNPLASMCGSIELLRDHGGSAEDHRLMDIVLREAGRLDALVSEFLAFARPAAPRPERTDVAEVLDETLKVFRNDPVAAAVRIEADLSPAVADCDPGQIRQVAWNLLANAAQALQAAARSAPRIRVRCAGGPQGVRIEVEDDGPGIPADDLGKIFLPFFTTKPRGTGLGLATVHRIVDAHRGSIRVASAPGAGCRFTVDLPPAGGGR